MFVCAQSLNPKCEYDNQGLILVLPKKTLDFLFLRSIMGCDSMRKEGLSQHNGQGWVPSVCFNFLIVYVHPKTHLPAPVCAQECLHTLT